MAGASIEIDSGPALAFLRRLGEHVDDLTPLMGQIGDYLIDSTRSRIDDQQAPDGTPWAPLSPDYARRKPKNADRILVLDNILRTTFAYNASAKQLEFGSNRIYAATHQFGRGPIPPRPFLGLSENDEGEVLALIREYVEAAL